ncbi:MAG: hypothetical protein SNJ56_05075, partial [Termitinemataceae bacterium]
VDATERIKSMVEAQNGNTQSLIEAMEIMQYSSHNIEKAIETEQETMQVMTKVVEAVSTTSAENMKSVKQLENLLGRYQY